MESFFGQFAGIFIVLVLCFVVFLAIRAIMLWYWKIDDIVANQEKQLNALKAILKKLTPSDELTEQSKS